MVWLYTHDDFLLHDTGMHPECAARLESIHKKLDKTGLKKQCEHKAWKPATLEQITANHEKEYLKKLEAFVKKGGGQLDADTVVSPDSLQAASLAAGAVCDAVDQVVKKKNSRALCLVRPPGHHAVEDSSMGFCLYNNIAIGAKWALGEHKLNRVMVIDWDVHHGNGTQDVFYDDPQVAFLSIHRWPFYPGTGAESETGKGDGLGLNVNIPLEFGTERKEFIKAFSNGIEALAKKHRPELILLSAGFDAHRLDPVGSLGLEVEDFDTLTETILALAREYTDGKIVSVLEGGYNVEILADCVEVHLKKLLGKKDE